jgi:MFS transporter, DHA1 family, inner membrane transport protein
LHINRGGYLMITGPRPTRTSLVLAVLFGGAFVMGCAEMLVVGLLDLIATDLAVSVPAAGALVTANALGLAIGGPLLTLLTIRVNRRRLLLIAMTVFVLANLLPALAADYPLFVTARVVIGAVQGLFIAAAITTATSIVAPERSGRAMAVVISGFATASALGLPVGTLLGQAVGWRGSFAAVVAVGVVVLAFAVVVLPSVPTTHESRAMGQARYAFAPRVLAVLALCFLIFTAIQSALTYLVPFLTKVTGVPGPMLSAFLLAYGVATTLGSSAGGRFADANAARSLIIGTIGVTASLVTMYVFGGSAPLAALAVLGIGLFGMGMAPSMQHRIVSLAGPGAPLASSLPASAVNAGIAFGTFAGGLAIDGGGVRAAVFTGAVVAGIAVVAAWATSFLRPAAVATAPEPRATEEVRAEEPSLCA